MAAERLKPSEGLYLHPTFVVTPQREPLGVVNAWTWAREFKTGDAPCGGLLESVRWIRLLHF